MSVKIILTDLDGTLLSGGQTAISHRNIEALKRAAEAGVYVVPCTGRCPDMLPPQLLTGDFVRYIVSCHGARVYDRVQGRTLYEHTFSAEESYEILKVIEKKNIYIEIYCNTHVYVEQHLADHLKDYPTPKHHTWFMYDKRYVAVENIAEHFHTNGLCIEKINIYGMPADIAEEVYQKLSALSCIRFTYPGAQPDLEICPNGLDKGKAVQALLDELNITAEEAFAIGDSHADFEVIDMVGVSVAMGNAVDMLKKAAKYITDLNTNDGVGKAIEKYVLGEGVSTELPSITEHQKKHDFLVCIDSDGCAVDTMEIKQKECFCTALIEVFGLQGIAKYAREAWDFANLYSKTRGFYRMKTLIITMDLLAHRREVVEKGFALPDLSELKRWCEVTPVLSDATLRQYAEERKCAILYKVLDWSAESNKRIKRVVQNVPPFLFVRESLQKLQGKADVVVVSATPTAALEKEWSEHDIKKYTSFICGQEYGNKKEIISAVGSQYAPDRVLMIGDALGDYQSATGAGVAFYPICPADEDASWKRFYENVSECFLGGQYTAEVQKTYVNLLDEALAEKPSWDTVSL